VLQQLGLFHRFDAEIAVPNVDTQDELARVLQGSRLFSPEQQTNVIREIQASTNSPAIGVGVKKVLMALETAREDDDPAGRFVEIMATAISATRRA